MLPLLIEAADQMEAIYWQTAYGDKEQLFEGITDSALIKYLSINYGPWDRLDANRPFLELPVLNLSVPISTLRI